MRKIKQKDVLLPTPFGTTVSWIVFLMMIPLFVSCSTSLYSVRIRYEPSKSAVKPVDKQMKYPVTVAAFNDARPANDDLLIGQVITSSGNRIPIIPKNNKLSKAVSESIKDYLRRAGYIVSDETPAWNLQDNSLKKEWGRILIGGKIDQVDIVCNDNIPIKRYNADVKLTVFFADLQKGRIFYIVSAQGTSSLEHVRFSEEILEQQINGALSYAIEDIFGGNTVQSKIKEALGQAP